MDHGCYCHKVLRGEGIHKHRGDRLIPNSCDGCTGNKGEEEKTPTGHQEEMN